jgi:glycosyltransferase involved in cell wall biosynthesis
MKLKIVHVLSALDQGGIEKWLVNLTEEFQRLYGTDIQIDILTLLQSGGYYQRRLESLGCRVYHCQFSWWHLPRFMFGLAALFYHQQYDVVHCHADYLSGLILPVACLAGVRARICHVHAIEFVFQKRHPALRYWIGRILRRLSVWAGKDCIGCSSTAIDSYLGGLKVQMRYSVCSCGIQCADYQCAVDMEKQALRKLLKWPVHSRVILHVGRHSEEKNLYYLLDIFAEILRRDNTVICMMAGNGPLTPALQNRATVLGIKDGVHFLGCRDDVSQLMRAADVLLFPSRVEGLGLVVVEAQAVGLRSLIADSLPNEVVVNGDLVNRMSIKMPPKFWAERAMALCDLRSLDPAMCLKVVEASSFNITKSAQTLMNMYIRA